MKLRNRSFLLSLLFLFVFVFSVCPISIAVIPVEPLGVSKNISMVITELIQSELAGKKVFKLVEREKLEEILKEQELQLSDITGKENAVTVGNLLNVDKILFGTIGLYSSDYIKYFLSLRLVDIEKGTVDAAVSTGISSENDLENGVEKAIDKLISSIAFTGYVVKVDKETVYTSFGKPMGASKGMVLSVYKLIPIRDASGKLVMTDKLAIANLITESVTENGSKCRVIESSGRIEEGFAVERGKAVISARAKKSTLIIVKSIPENARVFLNSQFLGVTPLEAKDLKPGRYNIEIRAGGYRAYYGKLTLAKGSHIVIERELEPVMEIEDLLLLGRLPKRKSDPVKAVTLALIPGLGENYVGYPTIAVAFPFAIFINASIALAYNNSRIEEIGKDDPYTSAEWDLRNMIIYSSSAVLLYLYSIIDSGIQSLSDFLYPVPLELSFGGAASYTFQLESGDNSIPEIDFMNIMSEMFLSVRSRSLFVSFGLQFNKDALFVLIDTLIRYPIVNGLYAGFGSSIYANTIKPNNEVKYEDISDIETSPSGFILPIVMLSYENTKFEGDILFSPMAFCEGWVVTLPSGSDWTESRFTHGLAGYMVRINLSYFFSIRFGINADLMYAAVKNTNELESPARIDSLQYMNARIGLIFRF